MRVVIALQESGAAQRLDSPKPGTDRYEVEMTLELRPAGIYGPYDGPKQVQVTLRSELAVAHMCVSIDQLQHALKAVLEAR